MKSLLVAHDAGGAECLSAYFEAFSDHQHQFDIYAEGPAIAVFQREGHTLLTAKPELQGASYGFVLTGSSMGSALENQMLIAARIAQIKSATLLEHWLHFEERFHNCGQLVLPDEIWVTDAGAQAQAAAIFPQVPILIKENWYWKKLKRLVRPGVDGQWLFALENRSHLGLSWLDSLNELWRWADCNRISHLIIRPHPTMQDSETIYRISEYLDKHRRGQLSNRELVADLSQVSGVLGFQTTVLALAVVCNKRAVSLIDASESLVIPFAGIELPNHIF